MGTPWKPSRQVCPNEDEAPQLKGVFQFQVGNRSLYFLT